MATSIGSLYGWTEADLLTALQNAAQDLAKGVVIVESSSGDVMGRKQMTNNPRERIAEIKANLGTLYLQDPVTYIAYEGFVLEGQNVVRANFAGSAAAASNLDLSILTQG